MGLLDASFPQTDDAFVASLTREAFLKPIDLSALLVYTDFLQSESELRDAELQEVRRWIDHAVRGRLVWKWLVGCSPPSTTFAPRLRQRAVNS